MRQPCLKTCHPATMKIKTTKDLTQWHPGFTTMTMWSKQLYYNWPSPKQQIHCAGILSGQDCRGVDINQPNYRSSHHAFSLRTSSSSSGVKSFLMLKRRRIS